MGAVTPLGNDVATIWQNLCAGMSGAGPITQFDADGYFARFACEPALNLSENALLVL